MRNSSLDKTCPQIFHNLAKMWRRRPDSPVRRLQMSNRASTFVSEQESWAHMPLKTTRPLSWGDVQCMSRPEQVCSKKLTYHTPTPPKPSRFATPPSLHNRNTRPELFQTCILLHKASWSYTKSSPKNWTQCNSQRLLTLVPTMNSEFQTCGSLILRPRDIATMKGKGAK